MAIEISSTSIISPQAKIADNVSVGPFCVIEDDVEIGAGTRLDSHVVIKRYTTLGEDNHLYPGVVLGNDPEDRNFTGERSYLKIGRRNVFRENSSASRGTPPESATVIGDDNYIMIGTHIAHNCRIGNNIVVCNNCSLAGYVEVGDGAFLSAGVLVHQFSKIGRLAMISGNTRVNLDVPPFVLASDYSVTAHGLNLVGLRRAGFSKDAILQLKQAYQILYRSRLPLEEALDRIAKEIPTPEARHLVEFIRHSKRGICRDSRAGSRRTLAAEQAAADDPEADVQE
ncbi:MAG: acyl-[acyl-carrier-protein]--UDP-N-acetylglucosamine O-acyltransferase [Acidobacteria bacterium RIFCSPLOWO2_02_FULL_61_28]|nr:MAG: acyl-[acyl-carrier-protein]--UDP-N-acetylglucosamine O-acyltransferase [Acidobacteria bacterium RIFCSPLOWO2_02_FULL_61_28]